MSKKKEKKQSKGPDAPDFEFGNRYNVLMIMADEFRFPIHKKGGGMTKALKNILGFQKVGDGDQVHIPERAKELFPGFMRLRKNAVSLRNHTVATTACVPSRAALFTGQYGVKNTVTQTDGVFKGASQEGFNWLTPEGLPTIGDWFRANNYTTHYFGKCHFAHPPTPTLEGLGFDNWETSYPEPHGTLKNNLGMYRDPGFTDLVTTFLRRKAMALDYDQEVGMIEQSELEHKEAAIKAIHKKPWFAVASFTNPHDITTWPVLPAQAVGEGIDDGFGRLNEIKPLGIPPQGTISAPPEHGTWTFDMNPGGIDASYAKTPTTLKEDLKEKPDCQFDYSLKLGIALAAKTGKEDVAKNSARITGLPLALAPNVDEWSAAYIEYYTYLHHVLDQEIERVLKTLDDSGLRDNTIVMFVPDHGEYGGSHGMMMQKWHTAYQEAIHVPVVISMPNQSDTKDDVPRQIEALTSHIDLAPTLLGLVGVEPEKIDRLSARILKDSGKTALDFVGEDLSGLITNETKNILNKHSSDKAAVRDAILFTTSDMITEPIDYAGGGTGEDFDLYQEAVLAYMNDEPVESIGGTTFEKPLTQTVEQRKYTVRLKEGPVVQPSEVHCVRQSNEEGDWKLVRYRDFGNPSNTDMYQWELYNLDADPNESLNLLAYKEYDPFIANPRAVDSSQNEGLNELDAAAIEDRAARLEGVLDQLVADLVEYPIT